MTILKFRLRQIIEHRGRKLPGKIHPVRFQKRYQAEQVGQTLYSAYSVKWSCQCDQYRSAISEIWNARPVPVIKFLSLIFGGAYTYLESKLTDSKGYFQYFADIKKALFPPVSEWPRQ